MRSTTGRSPAVKRWRRPLNQISAQLTALLKKKPVEGAAVEAPPTKTAATKSTANFSSPITEDDGTRWQMNTSGLAPSDATSNQHDVHSRAHTYQSAELEYQKILSSHHKLPHHSPNASMLFQALDGHAFDLTPIPTPTHSSADKQQVQQQIRMILNGEAESELEAEESKENHAEVNTPASSMVTPTHHSSSKSHSRPNFSSPPVINTLAAIDELHHSPSTHNISSYHTHLEIPSAHDTTNIHDLTTSSPFTSSPLRSIEQRRVTLSNSVNKASNARHRISLSTGTQLYASKKAHNSTLRSPTHTTPSRLQPVSTPRQHQPYAVAAMADKQMLVVEVQQLKHTLNEREQHVHHLQQQLQNHETTVRELLQNRSVYTDNVLKLESAMQQLQQQLENTNQQHQSTLDALKVECEQRIAVLTISLRNAEHDSEQKQQQIDTIRAEYDKRLQAEQSDYRFVQQQLESQRTEHQMQLHDAQTSLQQLQLQHTTLQQQYSQLQLDVTSKEQQLVALSHTLATTQQQLQQQLLDKDKVAVEHHEKLLTAKEKHIERLLTTITTIEADNTKLRYEVEHAYKHVNTLQADKQQLQRTTQAVQQQVQQLKAEFMALTQQQSLVQQSTAADQHHHSQQLHNKQQTIEQLQTYVQKLKAELLAVNQQLVDAQQTITILQEIKSPHKVMTQPASTKASPATITQSTFDSLPPPLESVNEMTDDFSAVYVNGKRHTPATSVASSRITSPLIAVSLSTRASSTSLLLTCSNRPTISR